MAKQMSDVNCSRGAPMGRGESGYGPNLEPGRHVRLFHVRLDGGGYDDGGAYWGFGKYGRWLYCAVSNTEDYRRFVRAAGRAHACLLLEIPRENLIQNFSDVVFGRYSATKGHFGKAEPGYEIKEFGQILTHVDSWEDLCEFAIKAEKAFTKT